MTAFRLHCASLPFWVLFQLRFVYSLFYEKLPKQFWLIALIAIGFGALIVARPLLYFDIFGIVHILIIIEVNRVVIKAMFQKLQGAWLIGIAFLVYYIFGVFDNLVDAGKITIFSGMENPYAYGSVVFFVAMSIYLSRDFARTNKKIAEQQADQKLLEAENTRQANELEAARQLQLSMLPKTLPEIPRLELAVFMKTATEVGGDYYDFKSQTDGSLTLVIGDATGHGMQAGTMVLAMKSLFHALAEEPDLKEFLGKCNAAIKAMGLKKMFMALTIARIQNDQVMIASAGMPFPLIYRSSNATVEEVHLKGMPLGGVSDFPYTVHSTKLNTGDTVLFRSDGLEEMFNPRQELFGDEKIKQYFQQTAAETSNKIIHQLVHAGEKWADGQPQQDDLTFVVVKCIKQQVT